MEEHGEFVTEGVPVTAAMPSTHTNLLYHVIFATKGREPWIAPEWRARLHEYLGGSVRGLGGVPQGVGGMADHVHLLVGLKPTHCLSDFLRDLKKNSFVWVSETMELPFFRWQVGFATYTVSETVKESVRRYIANQEEHHRHKTFREELIEFLKKSGIEHDERYLD